MEFLDRKMTLGFWTDYFGLSDLKSTVDHEFVVGRGGGGIKVKDFFWGVLIEVYFIFKNNFSNF